MFFFKLGSIEYISPQTQNRKYMRMFVFLPVASKSSGGRILNIILLLSINQPQNNNQLFWKHKYLVKNMKHLWRQCCRQEGRVNVMCHVSFDINCVVFFFYQSLFDFLTYFPYMSILEKTFTLFPGWNDALLSCLTLSRASKCFFRHLNSSVSSVNTLPFISFTSTYFIFSPFFNLFTFSVNLILFIWKRLTSFLLHLSSASPLWYLVFAWPVFACSR